jgi:hypothetical protein
MAFVQRRNLVPFRLEKASALQGLLLSRPSGRVAFGGATVWVAARSMGESVAYPFDERFPSDGTEVRRHRWGKDLLE